VKTRGERHPVIVAPFATERCNEWPLSHFREFVEIIVREHDVPVAVVGTLAQRMAANDLVRGLSSEDATNVCGVWSRSELVRAVDAAPYVVANNSCVAHLAAMRGRWTLCLFAGSHALNEWAPRGPRVVTVAAQVPCAPCGLDRDRCPNGLACMTELQPSKVFRLFGGIKERVFSVTPAAAEGAGLAAPSASDEIDLPTGSTVANPESADATAEESSLASAPTLAPSAAEEAPEADESTGDSPGPADTERQEPDFTAEDSRLASAPLLASTAPDEAPAAEEPIGNSPGPVDTGRQTPEYTGAPAIHVVEETSLFARSDNGAPWRHPCVIEADEMRVHDAYGESSQNRLRAGHAIDFEVTRCGDVDERVLFFGPYMSLEPGAYHVHLNGVLDGPLKVRLTRRFTADTLVEIELTDFSEPLALTLESPAEKFEIIGERTDRTRTMILRSILIEPASAYETVAPASEAATPEDASRKERKKKGKGIRSFIVGGQS
jgi:hypothetical protein